jgi:hypothetical protein
MKTKTLVEAQLMEKIWEIRLASDNPKAKQPELCKGQNLLGKES